MKKSRITRRTTQLSMENIMLNIITGSIEAYKSSFQPDSKGSPRQSKLRITQEIKAFCEIADSYGDSDKAFNIQEVLADLNDYRFGDAEYSTSRLLVNLFAA